MRLPGQRLPGQRTERAIEVLGNGCNAQSLPLLRVQARDPPICEETERAIDLVGAGLRRGRLRRGTVAPRDGCAIDSAGAVKDTGRRCLGGTERGSGCGWGAESFWSGLSLGFALEPKPKRPGPGEGARPPWAS